MWMLVLLLCTFPRTPSGTELTKVFHFIFIYIFLNDTYLKSRMVIFFSFYCNI